MDLVQLNQIYTKILLTLSLIKTRCHDKVSGFECFLTGDSRANQTICITVIEKDAEQEKPGGGIIEAVRKGLELGQCEANDKKSGRDSFIYIPCGDISDLEATSEVVMLGLLSKYLYGNSTENIYKNLENEREDSTKDPSGNQQKEEDKGKDEEKVWDTTDGRYPHPTGAEETKDADDGSGREVSAGQTQDDSADTRQ